MTWLRSAGELFHSLRISNFLLFVQILEISTDLLLPGIPRHMFKGGSAIVSSNEHVSLISTYDAHSLGA